MGCTTAQQQIPDSGASLQVLASGQLLRDENVAWELGVWV